MAVPLKNEGLPFIFFAGWMEVHPSICLFLQLLTISFYLLLSSVVVISVFLFFLFYFLDPLCFFWVCPKQTPMLSGVHTHVFLSFFLSFSFFFLLLRPSGWGSVFVQWDWSACVGFVAITPCIPACVCVPVQCCVQGTEACPSKRTTTGLFSHNPPHLVCYLD